MEKDTKVSTPQKENEAYIKTFVSTHKKKLLSLLGILFIIFLGWQFFGPKKQQVQYQTAVVTKGMLIQSLGESGSVAVANRMSVTTQTSGVVKEVDVKNGDSVTAGQTIAMISQDQQGQQKQAQAWEQYLAAKATLDAANATLYSLQSTMYTNWNIFFQKATNSTYQNPDGSPNVASRGLPDFTTSQDNWLNAQAQYQNQQAIIAQENAAVTSDWLSYQQLSAMVTAPTAGTIGDITIVPGMQITNTTSATTNTVSSQTIASIINPGNPVITVDLSEIDAAKVKSGEKATVTFDALPNKTFTGKVLGINTTGTVSSGVTTYPAIIQLDTADRSILPNMSATANIIVSVKNDVLTVPTSAIQTINNQSMVRVLQGGNMTQIPVETGIASDTDTEIISGLSEGQTVVTSFAAQSGVSSGFSPFGGNVRFGGFGGGGFRATGRGG